MGDVLDVVEYSGDHLSGLQGEIQGFVTQMDDALDNVKKVCAPLEDGTSFGGTAQGAYVQSKQIFEKAALEIAQVLNRLGAAVDGSGQSMRDADNQAASWFQD